MNKNQSLRKLLAAGLGGLIGGIVAANYMNPFEAFNLTILVIGIIFYPRQFVSSLREGLKEIGYCVREIAKWAHSWLVTTKANMKHDWHKLTQALRRLPTKLVNWPIAAISAIRRFATDKKLGVLFLASIGTLSAFVLPLVVGANIAISQGNVNQDHLSVLILINMLVTALLWLIFQADDKKRAIAFARLTVPEGENVEFPFLRRLGYYLWALFWWPCALLLLAAALGPLALGLTAFVIWVMLKLAKFDGVVSILTYGALGASAGYWAGSPLSGLAAGLLAGGLVLFVERFMLGKSVEAVRAFSLSCFQAIPSVVRY